MRMEVIGRMRVYVQTTYRMRVSIDSESTVHPVVVHCMQSYRGAPLVELSSYPFSKYMNFVADVNLARSLLHKSRRENSKDEA